LNRKLPEVEDIESPLMKHARQMREEKEYKNRLERIRKELGFGVYKTEKKDKVVVQEVEEKSVEVND